jgi:hypothetical protein
MPPRRWISEHKRANKRTGSDADRLAWLAWAISPTGLGAIIRSSVSVSRRSSGVKGSIIIAWRDDGVDTLIRARTLTAVIDKAMKATQQ